MVVQEFEFGGETYTLVQGLQYQKRPALAVASHEGLAFYNLPRQRLRTAAGVIVSIGTGLGVGFGLGAFLLRSQSVQVAGGVAKAAGILLGLWLLGRFQQHWHDKRLSAFFASLDAGTIDEDYPYQAMEWRDILSAKTGRMPRSPLRIELHGAFPLKIYGYSTSRKAVRDLIYNPPQAPGGVEDEEEDEYAVEA